MGEELAGKVALVTGSTRGIGWATACALAAAGATVALNGRSPEVAEARAAQLAELTGATTLALPFDVTDRAATKDAFRRLLSELGGLDVLVANAGVLGDALVGMIGDDLIDHTFEVNAKAAVAQVQLAARLMGRRGGGSIVLLSSIVGTQGNAGQLVYAATKAALVGLTKAAAKELGPKAIRVNAVAPGFIATDMVGHLPPDVVAQRVGGVAMGRAGTAAEVADVIVFLAGPRAAYVSGQVLGVDGGMVI